MNLTFEPEAPPLRVDEGGAVRVGQTRVLMVIVVNEFRDGSTPEQIVQSYDTLSLADVYAVIAYYLRNQASVDAYLEEYDRQAEEVWRKVQERQGDMTGIRERLLARRKVRVPEAG